MFDEENCLAKISKLGDPLEILNEVINWEIFRDPITQVCRKQKTSNMGRPPYDEVMMMKILVIQQLFNLSDDQTEYQINDRMSFKRFLGLRTGQTIPDAKTIWKFKNDLANGDIIENLFALFEQQLNGEGLITRKGSIVDATFVEAPKQRNSRDENKDIKEDKIPEEWRKPKNIHKLAQNDTDARWTIKNGKAHYGYKNHVKCNKDSKLITNYTVTDASVHDSQACIELLDDSDVALYADSAYSGKTISSLLPKNCDNQICEKGYRNRPLTEKQKENNRKKSKTRCRIEHIFGFMWNSMNGTSLRSIGIKRAKFFIGLTNLVYNMCRYRYLKRVTAHA